MAKRNSGILPYNIFVGERPWEDFSPEEKTAYANEMIQRMGRAMNDYFSLHPESYAKFHDIREEGDSDDRPM